MAGVPMPGGETTYEDEACGTSMEKHACGGATSWWFRLTHGAYSALYSLGFGMETLTIPADIKDIYAIKPKLISHQEHHRMAALFPLVAAVATPTY